MNDMFNSDFFAGNRARLRELFTGTAPIVLAANGLLQKSSDDTFPFRQDPNFWYLTGIDHPDIVLVMDKDKEYLIVPERDYFRAAFDGAIAAEDLQKRSGIGTILNDKDGWKQLSGKLKRAKHIATFGAGPAYAEWHGFYTNPARATLIAKLKTYNANLELLDLREHLAKMRMIKQPLELEALRRAIDVTNDGLRYVMAPSRLAKYATENEIEADLTRQFRRAGCDHAFDPVIASGVHTTQMHYFKGASPLQAADLLLFDVGAEAHYYAADVSRTVAIGGAPSKRQLALFDAVYEAQEYAFSLLRPGKEYKQYEKDVEAFIGEKLRTLGLIKTIDHDSVRHYFPHRTSHFLGLDTHDAGDYGGVFEPGMVFACEPGIYIPEEGIGVRLEDDVLITADSPKILSAALPRSLS